MGFRNIISMTENRMAEDLENEAEAMLLLGII